MGGVEGVRFVPLNLSGSGPADAVARLLLSGAVLRGRIAADGALLSLVVAGQRMPLPKSVALPPGIAVEVQLSKESGTAQLRLRVLDAPAQAVGTPSTPPQSVPVQAPTQLPRIPAALADLLKPEQAAALLPKLVALPPKALEALLTVFVTRSDAGRALARLASLVRAEVVEGRLPTGAGAALETLAQTMDAESPEEFRRAIDLARELIGARGDHGTAEAPRAARETARAIVDELAQLREPLGNRGAAAGEMVKTADGFIERLTNSTLQNVRALDAPYQFLAVPFAPRTGIEHAQVHIVGRDGRGTGGGDREAQFIVLDLQLTHLGALWITIQSAGAACRCVIHAEDEGVRSAIDQGSPALEEGLRRAGFTAALVRTEAWDGDRAGAAAALFAQSAGFEAEV